MSNTRLQPLQAEAIEIIRQNPSIDIKTFAEIIRKNYQHAASLMSFARKQLGQPARESPTKVDKTMALIHLGQEVKGRRFRDLLEVKACRASELRHTARKRLSGGIMPSPEAIDWANRARGHKTIIEPEFQGDRITPQKMPGVKAKKQSPPNLTAQSTPNGEMSVQSVERQPKNPTDLVRESGLDPEEWVIASQIVNRWEMGAKHPETGEILVEPLFQTKVRLEPVGGAQGVMSAINEMIQELRSNPPSLPEIQRTAVTDGHMAEIAIPDLHLGKFGSESETGEPYSPAIACRIFKNAIDDLISQISNAYPIEKIVFPIGNDFLTADTPANTTTRGTAQDVEGNFEQHFALGWKLLREGIEKLRIVAPVDVVVVPGNHDAVASFAIGQLLGAVYEGTEDVTVHYETLQPRKYISYGLNLLGFAHGHMEKARSLPMLMATEAPVAWGKSRHREIHVGHLHHTRDMHFLGSNEVDGIILRVIPSLSGSDRWHAAKGYRSQRAALAMVYHPQLGQRAVFRHSILDALRINVADAA